MEALFDDRRVSLALEFDLDERHHTKEMTQAMQRISVSGVQEKFPAVVDEGKIRLAFAGERSTHILKPAPWDATLIERRQIPVNEHLTMQIASQVYGIVVAANGLCTTPSGRYVYVTRRFDIGPDGAKNPMEDMASLIGKSETIGGATFKYNGSYMDIAQCIRRYIPAWMPEMERFFELVVFNYIYANGDAHLKNFSVMLKDGDYSLTPAYDLLNTAIHVQDEDFALDGGLSPNIPRSSNYNLTGHPCRKDFEWFGKEIGLVEIRMKRILDNYMSLPEQTKSLVKQSHFTEKLKRHYLRVVNERIARFAKL